MYKLASINYNISEVLEDLRRNNRRLIEKQNNGEKTRSNTGSFSKILDVIWYKRTYKQFCTREDLYRPLLLLSFMAIIQQFAGSSILRSYVVKIFNNIGGNYTKYTCIRGGLKKTYTN